METMKRKFVIRKDIQEGYYYLMIYDENGFCRTIATSNKIKKWKTETGILKYVEKINKTYKEHGIKEYEIIKDIN